MDAEGCFSSQPSDVWLWHRCGSNTSQDAHSPQGGTCLAVCHFGGWNVASGIANSSGVVEHAEGQRSLGCYAAAGFAYPSECAICADSSGWHGCPSVQVWPSSRFDAAEDTHTF